MNDIKDAFAAAVEDQTAAVQRWHETDPTAPEAPENVTLERLRALVLAQHMVNFLLWHEEDRARSPEATDTRIAAVKRAIDKLNQRRNDLIEQVDQCFIALMTPLLPPLDSEAGPRYNTETLGSALDRLSILSLKRYHMAEQAGRADAAEAHRRECNAKLQVMAEQHADLTRSCLELMDEYAAGRKRPKVYYQFKMYNDPSLNPEIYNAASQESTSGAAAKKG